MPVSVVRLAARTLLGIGLLTTLCGCADTSGHVISDAENLLDSRQLAVAHAPINACCPLHAANKVDPELKPKRYKGRLIGFCSAECYKKWDHWTVARRDGYVNRQLALARGDTHAQMLASERPNIQLPGWSK